MDRLTPQQLMHLPGAGASEKKLRAMGKWELTPIEKVQLAIDSVYDAISDIEECVDATKAELERAIKAMEAINNEN